MGEHVEKRVEIGLAKDGSGVGGEQLVTASWCLVLTSHCLSAALCALQAIKQYQGATHAPVEELTP